VVALPIALVVNVLLDRFLAGFPQGAVEGLTFVPMTQLVISVLLAAGCAFVIWRAVIKPPSRTRRAYRLWAVPFFGGFGVAALCVAYDSARPSSLHPYSHRGGGRLLARAKATALDLVGHSVVAGRACTQDRACDTPEAEGCV